MDEQEQSGEGVENAGQPGEAGPQLSPLSPHSDLRLPCLTPGGDLVIPFDSPERYHWWKPGGQSAERTRAELDPDAARLGR
jgi:hypothetical protein